MKRSSMVFSAGGLFGALFVALWAICSFPAVAATLLPPGESTFLDSDGNPLSLGSVEFYIPNTLTPKNTWQDSGGTILNNNPLTLDAAGRAVIYGSGSYREIVKDADGNVVWDQLTADTAPTSAQIVWGGTSAGSANAQTITAADWNAVAGAKLLFVAGFTNTSSLTVNINSTGAISVLKASPGSPVVLTGSEVTTGDIVELDYDGSTFQIVNPITTNAYNLAVTGTLSTTSTATLGAAVIQNSVITPTILAANTDDWAPASFSSAYVVRASASMAINLTGIAGGASGREFLLDNVGSYTITLLGNNASSTAANRFLLPAPVALRPSQSVTLEYDSTSAGWRMKSPLPTVPVAAGFKNLKVQTTSNTVTALTADALTLEDANGSSYRARTVSLSIDITASGANGLDTGAEASSTWYSVWAIYNPTTNVIAGLLSASATTPTLPSGYTFYSRFGWVRNDGSSNLLRTLQYGRIAQYVVGTNPTLAPNIANGVAGTWSDTSPVLAAVSITTFVPTTASRIQIMGAGKYAAGTAGGLIVAPNTSWGGTNNGPAGTAGQVWPLVLNSAAPTITGMAWLTLEATTIAWSSDHTGSAISCLGWEDNLT